MAGAATTKEPTMEEILASIRRIISEDDEPKGAGGDEDVLDLTDAEADPIEEDDFSFEEENAPAPPKKSPPREDIFAQAKSPDVELDDVMVLDADDFGVELEDESEAEAEAPAFDPAPSPPPAPRAVPADDRLLGDPAASRAASSIGRLMGAMMVTSGATLDDVVRELLKPLLKDWLDAHLPTLVEAEVAKEIERISRMAR
ncbi:DUF2497 domain-containing protein [bacterium]|nr:DUF2497 domain-containing protein [bacterium]